MMWDIMLKKLKVQVRIVFNFLVLLKEVNQRWVYPDDLARHKLEFFMVLGG